MVSFESDDKLVLPVTTKIVVRGEITLHYKGTTINVPTNTEVDLKDVPQHLYGIIVNMIQSKANDYNVFINI